MVAATSAPSPAICGVAILIENGFHSDAVTPHPHQVDQRRAARIGDSVLAVTGEHEVIRSERPTGSDLRRLLPLQRRPQRQLPLPLQGRGLDIQPTHHDHVLVEAQQVVGRQMRDAGSNSGDATRSPCSSSNCTNTSSHRPTTSQYAGRERLPWQAELRRRVSPSAAVSCTGGRLPRRGSNLPSPAGDPRTDPSQPGLAVLLVVDDVGG